MVLSISSQQVSKNDQRVEIEDAVNDDNPTTNKVFDDKTKSIYFYCNNLSHNNSNIVRFLMTGASDLISNSAHFSFTTSTGHMILNISGIFKSILKDQYKCPACDKKINPRSVKKSNPIDKSLNKNAINEITLSYKYGHKKPRFFKKAYKRFKTLDMSCNLSSSCLIVGGTRAGGVATNLYT